MFRGNVAKLVCCFLLVLVGIATSFGQNLVNVSSTNPASGISIDNTTDLTGTSGSTTPYSLNYNNGTSATFTAPFTGSATTVFDRWSINGVDQPSNQNSITTTINANTTVVAKYKARNFVFNVFSNVGSVYIDCTTDSTSTSGSTTPYALSYAPGTSVTLSAPAFSGSNGFDHWVVNGVNQPQYQTAVVIGANLDVNVTAVFYGPVVSLAVSSPNSIGVILQNSLDLTGTTSGYSGYTLNYHKGDSVTLTAPTTSGNATLQGWQVNGVLQASQTYTFTITANSTARAIYSNVQSADCWPSANHDARASNHTENYSGLVQGANVIADITENGTVHI